MNSIWSTYVGQELPLSKGERKEIQRDAWRMWMKIRWNLVLYLVLPGAYLIFLAPARNLAGLVAGILGISGTGYHLFRVGGMIGLVLVIHLSGPLSR